MRPAVLELGLRTIRNFLIAAGHIDATPELTESAVVLTEGGQKEQIDAPETGLWHPLKTAGEMVSVGDTIGHILCLDTFRPIAELKAGLSGLLVFAGPPIWGEDHREHQIAFSGQPLVRIQQIKE